MSEDHGNAGDVAYALGFTSRGELVVRVTKHPAEQYRTPEDYDIGVDEFTTVNVHGTPLLSLILAKLNEILPNV